MNRITSTEALEISMEIGRILLQNGSTANRVELMMCKVCSIFGYPETEAYVTPTGIFLLHPQGLHSTMTFFTALTGPRFMEQIIPIFVPMHYHSRK